MDDVPPPTEHVLRPHHVGLLTVLVLTFKELVAKTVPTPFILHLYRELLNEIAEACLITCHPAHDR
jgi:anaphase-promoting complex subunit 5